MLFGHPTAASTSHRESRTSTSHRLGHAPSLKRIQEMVSRCHRECACRFTMQGEAGPRGTGILERRHNYSILTAFRQTKCGWSTQIAFQDCEHKLAQSRSMAECRKAGQRNRCRREEKGEA